MLTTFALPTIFRCQHFSPNILFPTIFRSTIFHPTFSKKCCRHFSKLLNQYLFKKDESNIFQIFFSSHHGSRRQGMIEAEPDSHPR
jgi:hypothetical protein